MRILIRVLVFVGVLVLGLLGIGFLLSDKAHVERSTAIEAPPETIFAIVNSFKEFDQWSPWADIDPNVKVTRSGPDEGVGAAYAWAGNADVGSGNQEITGSRPYSEVRIRLTFGGFDQANDVMFVIKPEGTGSQVTWIMDANLGTNPINRYFGLFMDKMIGPDYVKGLGRLKTLAEAKAKAPAVEAPVPVVEPTEAPPAAPVS